MKFISPERERDINLTLGSGHQDRTIILICERDKNLEHTHFIAVIQVP